MKNLNLSRSGEKEAPAEQAFTFPGAIPTKSKVRSTAATKWLDFGGEEVDCFEFVGVNDESFISDWWHYGSWENNCVPTAQTGFTE